MALSSLKMIVDGKRNLTVSKVHELAEALYLEPRDHDYFESLVHFEQAKTKKEKDFYLRRLNDIKALSSDLKLVQTSDKEIISKWYVPALLIYVVYVSKGAPGSLTADEAKYFSQQTGISHEELDQALQTLKNTGILDVQKEENTYISFQKMGQTVQKQTFLDQLFELSRKRMIKGFRRKDHYFEAHTFSLDTTDIKLFIKDYKQLVETHMSKPHQEGDETRVMQSLVSFFPVL